MEFRCKEFQDEGSVRLRPERKRPLRASHSAIDKRQSRRRAFAFDEHA